ncbi:phylloplanin-like [Argentina anserina]|uniref:phylloplanin-like n=1 Tax=Argentina anserina TaxID=57926 RepID=UPI0021767721|nr:phylloplanin-like [Potentilla anserina]
MAPTKKTMLFVCLLVAAVAVVVPVAQGNAHKSISLITGKLFCTLNGNGTASSPPFPNASVQLRCGSGNGKLFETAKTNSTGQFSILEKNLPYTVAQVLSGCRVVVATPFKKCNSTLPAIGTVASKLTLNPTPVVGPKNVTIYKAVNFKRL